MSQLGSISDLPLGGISLIAVFRAMIMLISVISQWRRCLDADGPDRFGLVMLMDDLSLNSDVFETPGRVTPSLSRT
jgi:hypothetical protein